MTLTAVLVKET